MIINITDQLKVPGVYKLTYDNGKIYIGQAVSIWSRAHEHNSKNRYPCDKALKKHEASIEILEVVQDVTQLDEVESKWICQYNATNKEIGYNILSECNASGKSGTDNCNAAFNKEVIQQIYDLLLNHTELSYIDIANKYNVSQDTILKISKGYTYYNAELCYPLRKQNHDANKKNDLSDYFDNEEDIYLLKDDLKYRWDLSIENDLSQKYNLPIRVLRDINHGRKFQNYGEYTYPIRQKNIRNNNNFTYDTVLKILFDLRYTNLPAIKLAEKYGIHRNTIAAINTGQTYYIKDYDYPARN